MSDGYSAIYEPRQSDVPDIDIRMDSGGEEDEEQVTFDNFEIREREKQDQRGKKIVPV